MNRIKSAGWCLMAAALFALTLLPAESAKAQSTWGIGASYEMRDLDPTNGFGVRVQRNILGAVPIIDLGLRAHFSFFNESVESYRDFNETDLESYDFGLAGYGGVNIGLLKPYAGVGLGSESFEAVQRGAEEGEFEDNSIYWNIFVGAELSPIPFLKPFIEYRFTRLFDDDGFDHRQNGRLAIGLTLAF
jgi:opacity protein-like surface antigen